MKMVHFTNRDEMHKFLEENHQSDEGMFIKFDKRATPNKLKPEEALEEALSYGWIDGLIKKINDDFYLKYFSKRRPKSIWSTKNKSIAMKLIKEK
ncbi:MAG: YdeI family protein, partial [Candidatus Izemoplasmatales bacterium]